MPTTGFDAAVKSLRATTDNRCEGGRTGGLEAQTLIHSDRLDAVITPSPLCSKGS
jgi:hypothetical protein